MKYTVKILLLLIIIIWSNFNLFAQQGQTQKLEFSGRIVGAIKMNNLLLSIDYYNTNEFISPASFLSVKTDVDSLGNFKLALPDLNQTYLISIVLQRKENDFSQTAHHIWSDSFYAEPKDNININITVDEQKLSKSSVLFSGAGSEKYNLIEKIQGQFFDYQVKSLPALNIKNGKVKDLDELNSKMEGLAAILKMYSAKKADLINNADISSELKKTIKHEFGNYSSEWQFRSLLLYQANSVYQKEIGGNFLRYCKDLYDKPDEFCTLCPEYLVRLSAKDAFEQMISTNSVNANIVEVYNKAKINYSGAVRDNLISNCFLSLHTKRLFAPYNISTRDSLLTDAFEIVKVPAIKKALTDLSVQLNKVKPQIKVIDADFFGIDGKVVNLKTLKGKVIFIDVWFNGCAGCAESFKKFETEIFPNFKDNKQLIVLSLNIDQTKAGWVKGIDSHHYTSEKYLNLWTGNGVNHPFTKYYSINGAPYIMIVDTNGDVFAKNDAGTSTVPGLIKEINEALNSKPKELN